MSRQRLLKARLPMPSHAFRECSGRWKGWKAHEAFPCLPVLREGDAGRQFGKARSERAKSRPAEFEREGMEGGGRARHPPSATSPALSGGWKGTRRRGDYLCQVNAVCSKTLTKLYSQRIERDIMTTVSTELRPSLRPQDANLGVTGPGRQRGKERPGTVARRQQRFRHKVLTSLWAPRGVATCQGPDCCPWRPGDEPCACVAGSPCKCERHAFNVLEEEGRAYFGSIALSGLVARSVLETARAELSNDPRAHDYRLRLLTILASDSRKAQDLAQRERRLSLEESRAKPKAPSLAAYLEQRSKSQATAQVVPESKPEAFPGIPTGSGCLSGTNPEEPEPGQVDRT